MEQLAQLKKPFIVFICKLFKRGTSAFLIILGRRDTGKTDFGLLISEIVAREGIIKHVATNIKIYDSPFPIEHITSLDDLKSWVKNTSGRKLFIFDEFGKAMRRRMPMSSLNIHLIDQFQILRKYKLSTIAITVNEKFIDSAVLGTDLLDGYFRKPNYKNRKIALYFDLLENVTQALRGIPKTSIHYDTWDVAPFKEHSDTLPIQFKDKHLEILWKWSHGATGTELHLHPQQINRITRKFIRDVLEKQHSDITK